MKHNLNVIKPRIMVADDNRAFLQKVVLLLTTEFDIVATATDGKSTLNLTRHNKPDVQACRCFMASRLHGNWFRLAEALRSYSVP
jgi:CheY-like chemotaxis protein